VKVLLEMRPALDGISGIPQETRLLYRGLIATEGLEVLGLLQSSNLVLEPGLPVRKGEIRAEGLSAEARLDCSSKVVVSLLQGASFHRVEHWRRRLLQIVGPFAAMVRSTFGGAVPLTGFVPANFEDFVWRNMFAKSLPPEDFDAVTRCEHRVFRWPWSFANAWGVVTGSMGRALYPRLDTQGIDVMIAETPYPGRPRKGTQMVVRYHDAIPLLMPHTVKDRGYHRAMHFHALLRNAADGAWFACVSESTRQDLLSLLPHLEPRTVTIPNMISHHYFPDERSADRVPEIIWSRRNRQAPHEGGQDYPAPSESGRIAPYLLMVSTIEPRKNHEALADAWEQLRMQGHPDLQLVIVGGLGWDHGSMLERFKPWLRRGGLHLLHDVPADDLRLLYRHAAVTVCPSFGEGFGFSGVEAMRSGGVVAASDIRVHREVYDDASLYFNPYAPAEMAAVIGRLLAPCANAERESLRLRGAEVARRYLPEAVLPQWRRFLGALGGEIALTPSSIRASQDNA